MSKKIIIISILVGVFLVGGIIGVAAGRTSDATTKFYGDGYVLCDSLSAAQESKYIPFAQGEQYSANVGGAISFNSTDNRKVSVDKQSFACYVDGSFMAFSDGVLIDLDDVSKHYITNYYVNAGLVISPNGNGYRAITDIGEQVFGDHIWKLSANKYVIRSTNTLKIYNIPAASVVEVSGFVQVVITSDNVVVLLTDENSWTVFNDDAYIETSNGTKIYPVLQYVESNEHKTALNTITVSPDEAVVLSDSQIRRQIVPQINIKAVDGTNGTNGTNGGGGTTGGNGNRGGDGSRGTDGGDGTNGSDGYDGQKGDDGKDKIIESSVNTVLPTARILDWQVSATQLKACVKIVDPEVLYSITEVANYFSKYPASVIITNVKTGKEIFCYDTNNDYEIIKYTNGEPCPFDLYDEGLDEIYFSTFSGALEPDTEYKLTIDVYYKSQEEVGLIMQRQLLNRTFFTDSTGIVISADACSQTSVSVNARKSSSALNATSVTVYLLNHEQAKNFSIAQINSENYIRQTISAGETATFTGLEHNTSYIARVYIELSSGGSMLTNQQLELKTLKFAPEKDKDDVPTVTYNRMSGAYEVTRPKVTDVDSGTQYYTYTVYYSETGNSWEVFSSPRTIAKDVKVVEYHLDTQYHYKFGVEMCFNDNEKTIFYDLGTSSPIKVEGDAMPSLRLVEAENDSVPVSYDKYHGTLTIRLGGNSFIKQPSTETPIVLELFADGIRYEKTVMINTVGTEVNVHDASSNITGTVMVNPQGGSSNEMTIELNLKNLFRNTTYAITVHGYMSLGESAGDVESSSYYRVIGTTTFRTYNVLPITVSYTKSSEATQGAFAQVLKLTATSTGNTPQKQVDYANQELKRGQVSVVLSSGTGIGKVTLAQKNFTSAGELDQIYGEGYTLTQGDFKVSGLSEAATYTLTVTSVTDDTYNITGLEYVNEFTNIIGGSEIITVNATPPSLLQDSTKGITVTAIYNNEKASSYGATYNPALPEYAVIGYALKSTFSNEQRLGFSITYYAFEYNVYYNSFRYGGSEGKGMDPIKNPDASPVFEKTLDIDSGSNYVPQIVILFGGDEAAEPIYRNGYYVYNAGIARSGGGSLVSGMGRGFRYVFAYTVKYSLKPLDQTAWNELKGNKQEQDKLPVYPYNHPDYNSFASSYGGITQNGVSMFRSVAYVLNSGMVEAPSIAPDFHSFVYSTTTDDFDEGATIATGTVTLHYTFRDPDGLITVGDPSANTRLAYVGALNATHSQDIDYNVVVVGTQPWYTIDIVYDIQKGDSKLIDLTANITNYKLEYGESITAFNYPADQASTLVAEVPVEWAWDKEFAQNAYQEAATLTLEKHYDQNYMDFIINGSNSTQVNAIVNRATMISITFVTSADYANETTFVYPLNYDYRGAYVRISTGSLDANAYLHNEFTVIDAKLYYDTGSMGWNSDIEQSENGFLIQKCHSPQEQGLGKYLYAANAATIVANDALRKGNSSVDTIVSSLYHTIGATYEQSTFFVYTPYTSNYNQGYYVYPTEYGVDFSESSYALSNENYVLKKVGTYSLMPSQQTNWIRDTISDMTPTLTYSREDVSSSVIRLNEVHVGGMDSAGEIFCALYLNEAAAHSIANNPVKLVKIFVDDNGNVQMEGGDEQNAIILDELQGKQKYFVTMYYVNSIGENVLLRNANSSEEAIYEILTSDESNITITSISYSNTSYFDKQLVIYYDISRTYNLYTNIDIYDDSVNAEAGDVSKAVLTHTAMNTNDENDILDIASTLVSKGNRVKILLNPSWRRAGLEPGKTYYLRVTAYEEGGEAAGYGVEQFTIAPATSPNALIYVQDATSVSISYQVSITDLQYSLMSADGEVGKSAGGLYAVRFTDQYGNRLFTIYDNKVYSMTELRKPFVLCDKDSFGNSILLNADQGYSNLNPNIVADRKYQMHIYAIKDMDHNGEVTLSGYDSAFTWDNFFTVNGSDCSTWGSNFLSIVDSLWDGETYYANNSEHDTAYKKQMKDLADQLEIAYLEQSTTTDIGWTINEGTIRTDRLNNNRIRIYFAGSYGLVDSSNNPVFSKITWEINGYNADGQVIESGELRRSQSGAVLIVAGTDSGNYQTYYLDIPYTLSKGNYAITIDLYFGEGDKQYEKRITVFVS